MIIDSSQGNIEVYGDIKEFKTSIDPKNLEFITTLLSSNLYSDPEQSFIREIVSNAWDSHVEAGTTDVPVIVRFRNNTYDKSITIRDYGTGLSPERFKEVYCNIGSSTKRESNDFIGGFGIGKYSSLACSNTVYITSYYEGTAYYYVMVKSGNSITTNLLQEKPTAEKNGVEVTIKNIFRLEPYFKALQYIIFFPNVYIDGGGYGSIADEINNTKLKRFKNFAAASQPVGPKLLLGNVLYPCNNNLLNNESRAFLNKIDNTGIVIKFDVGEINITPNRESIIYNSDAVKKIEDRIEAARIELDAMVNARMTKDYDDLVEYHRTISSDVKYDPITDEIVSLHSTGYRVTPANLATTSITYRGRDLRNIAAYINTVVKMTLPNFKGVIDDDKICVKNIPYSYRDNNTVLYKKLLVLNEGARLTAAVKLYLKENYNGYGAMTYIDREEYKKYVKAELKGVTFKDADFVLDGLYESFMGRATELDLETDQSFLDFKADLAASKSPSGTDIRESILYVWNDRGYKEKLSFKRFSQAVSYVKGLKKGVILCNMDADDSVFSSLANLKGFVYIKARKDIVNDLRNLQLSCIVDTGYYLVKDPTLSVVKTLLQYFPEKFPDISEICKNIDKDTAGEFKRLLLTYNKFAGSYQYRGILRAGKEEIKLDPYTECLCLRLVNYVKKHTEAQCLVGSIRSDNSLLTTAVVMRTRAYKISGEAYNRIKDNPLLRVLCKK